MAPTVTVLKKRHSLRGANLLPLVGELKLTSTDDVRELARVQAAVRTDDLDMSTIEKHFTEITGECLADVLDFAGREMNMVNARLALHFSIIHANARGQPAGQDLSQPGPSSSRDQDADVGPPQKRAKPDAGTSTLESRIESLERSAGATKPDDTVDTLREKGNTCGKIDSLISVPHWETDTNFDAEDVAKSARKTPAWLTIGGRDGPQSPVHVRAEDALSKDQPVSLDDLLLRDPDKFVSGELHNHLDEWEKILTDDDIEVKEWLNDGVDVKKFFQHFRGSFKGKCYDSDSPPPRYFPNSSLCKTHSAFVVSELTKRIQNGSIRVWGRLGECPLPKVIMPLTVEPTKPRLCHDDRYLNLWTKDVPFQLETLKHVHRMVGKNARMVTCDDKSGYDHVKLTLESQTYFGIQFGGWVMSYTTLPFGWKASASVYQSIGMTVTAYLRSLGLCSTQYIDDRFTVSSPKTPPTPCKCLKMTYTVVEILTRLGYTLSLEKCFLVPTTSVRYLGFVVDSVRQAYILPTDKKVKFMTLRDSILSSKQVEVKTLQRFAGKCVSMGLAIPAARLYTREVNLAISSGIKNSRSVPIQGSLQTEIEHWKFLDTWEGCMLWRPEYHEQISLATDASMFKYGGTILSGSKAGFCLADYWDDEDKRPIHLKEADALLRVVKALKPANQRVDILTDNMAVLSVWNNQGGRDPLLNDLTKDLFQYVFSHNVDLHMGYIPSNNNPADAPSRKLSLTDSMLADNVWDLVQSEYGPHSLDMMSLDSNSMKSHDGSLLKHYTPWPTPLSSGVNIFAQEVSEEPNPYVFPPFALIFPLISFLQEQKVAQCTLVAPVFHPTPVWWPFLMEHCQSSLLLGSKGETRILKLPSKKGFIPDAKGLRWELRAFRLAFYHAH